MSGGSADDRFKSVAEYEMQFELQWHKSYTVTSFSTHARKVASEVPKFHNLQEFILCKEWLRDLCLNH